MTITVSISDFRQNIAQYLAQTKAGHTLLLKDNKKGEIIATLTGRKKFNPEVFGRTLRSVAGTFTAKNHPEWKTKKNVIRWVEKSRKLADRSF